MNLKWNKGESMDGTGWTEAKMGGGESGTNDKVKY